MGISAKGRNYVDACPRGGDWEDNGTGGDDFQLSESLPARLGSHE